MELLKSNFLDELKLKHLRRRNQIQVDTIGQAKNLEWLKARTGLLTASNFGQVCCAKGESSYGGLVEMFLYTNLSGIEAIEFSELMKKRNC